MVTFVRYVGMVGLHIISRTICVTIWCGFTKNITNLPGVVYAKIIVGCVGLVLRMRLSDKPRHEKTNVLVSDLVRHKPGCKAKEDAKRPEISVLGSKGIVLSM